jgi:capsular exopolysaccharide synthesis family protein
MESGQGLRWYILVLCRWWWLILVCTLLAAGAAYVVSAWTQPVYSATAILLVDKAQAREGSGYTDIMASERLANTYSQMITGQPVLEEVAIRLGLQQSPQSLASRIAVLPVPDTQLIRVSVESTDAGHAALLADTVAQVFVEQIQAKQVRSYAGLLDSLQARMQEVSAATEEIEASIESLSAEQVAAETALARSESQLDGYREDLRLLQQDYEGLRFAMAQSGSKVSIVEVAQLPADPNRSPYTATVTLLLGQPTTSLAAGSSEELVRTYGRMLLTRPVLDEALERLGSDEPASSLAGRAEAVPIPDTRLLQLSVVDADPDQAARLANTVAEVFVAHQEATQQEPYLELLADMQAQMDELDTSVEDTQVAMDALAADKIAVDTELAYQENLLAEYRSDARALRQDYDELQLLAAQLPHDVSISETAGVPKTPIRPRTMLSTVLAALVGMAVGAGAAFLLEYLDDTIRTPEDVKHALGLGTVGTIGRLSQGDPPLVVAAEPRSPIAESFRVLATNIRYASVDRPTKTLMVTSPQPMAGKSFVLANLALAAAQNGLRVIAVDADLHRPRLHTLFGLNGRQGLTDSLLEGDVDGNLQLSEVSELRVLPSGPLPPNPSAVVASQRLRELVAGLAEEADLVLLDSAPLLAVADALALAALADGVLLVLDAGQSRRQDARRALESVQRTGARVVGVVLNRVAMPQEAYYYGGRRNGGNGKNGLVDTLRRAVGRRQA